MKLARGIRAEKGVVEAMPVVMAQTAAVPSGSAGKPRVPETTSLAPGEASAIEDATLGLVALGYRKAEAGPRAHRALDRLRAAGGLSPPRDSSKGRYGADR